MSNAAVTDWFPPAGKATVPRYSCLLSEQPRHTTPRRLLAALPVMGADASIADSLVVADVAELPGDTGLAPGPVAVVDDPLRGVLPYWLDPRTAQLVCGLRDGEVRAEALSPTWSRLLSAVGLLRCAASAKANRRYADELIESAAPQLQADGYVALPGLVHPFHLGELRLHLRRLVRLGQMQDGDGQTPLRWVRHNDAALGIFHRGLTGLVSAIVGEPTKPSYVYAAVYHDGACLPRHIDRPQCAYTLSLCVDCIPEPYREVPWPIELEASGRRVSVYQGLGDGLLFKGAELAHGRPPLPEGFTVAAVFCHYVPTAFTGSLI